MKNTQRLASILTLLIASTSLFALGGDMGRGTDPSANGSSSHPWLIEDLADFNRICQYTRYWSKNVYIRLERDLDLASLGILAYAPIAPYEHTSFQYKSIKYNGVFDGNGHTLKNLFVNSTNYCGLFGHIGTTGTVKNLGLSNATISSPGSYVGGIAGYSVGNTISNCFITGTVSGEWFVGGICGLSSSNITKCHANIHLKGYSRIGGIVGKQYSTTTECYMTGAITHRGGPMAGGLIGYHLWGTMTNCTWDTESTGFTNSCGANNASISNTFGMTTAEMQTESNFTDRLHWSVGEYTTWTMDGYPVLSWQLEKLGGGRGTPENPYRIENYIDFLEFRSDTSLWANTAVRLDCNLDLSRLGTLSTAAIGWDTDPDSSYDGPPYSGRFLGNNHIIRNLTINGTDNYLGLFGYISYSASISDLNMENCSVTGSNTYNGILAGVNTGHITNCHTSGTVNGKYTSGGLCGLNSNSGHLLNCSSVASVSGTTTTGGLVGRNKESISQCHYDGTVTAYGHIAGGLCGVNANTITQCYSTGQVESDGFNYVGSFCSVNENNITNCYSTASASGKNYVSGFVASNENGTIENCYAMSQVTNTGTNAAGFCSYQVGSKASIKNCFWNTFLFYSPGYILENSSPGTITNVQGLNSNKFLDQDIFLNAGWDFVKLTTNGTDDFWVMSAISHKFPILSYQKNIPGDIAGDYGVDLIDFAELAAHWQTTYNMNTLADLAEYWLTAK